MLVIATAFAAAGASCSTPTTHENGAVTDGGKNDAGSCEGVSENVVPTGTCSIGAGPCPVYVGAHCDPSPENSKGYSCSCPNGTWQCKVITTGLSLPICDGGDAG